MTNTTQYFTLIYSEKLNLYSTTVILLICQLLCDIKQKSSMSLSLRAIVTEWNWKEEAFVIVWLFFSSD